MVSAADRITHYNNRMVSTLIDPVLTAVSAAAQADFATYAADFVPFQEALRTWLNGLPAHPSEFFSWEALNGEVYHATKVAAGGALVALVTDLQTKYVAYGLGAANIKAMVLIVYSITIP